MAIGTTNIVAPVLAATKVVPFFFAGMAAQTSFRNFFRRFIFERNDLGNVALGDMVLSRTVTCFTASDLAFPAADLGKLGMRGVRVGLELVLVTVLAGVTTDVPRIISGGD
jgi:hypothetical protein